MTELTTNNPHNSGTCPGSRCAGMHTALEAIRDALTLPYAATVDGDKARAKIFENRLMYVTSFLNDVLAERPGMDLGWEIAFLAERIAKHAAAGYVTHDQAQAALAQGATWSEAVALPVPSAEGDQA